MIINCKEVAQKWKDECKGTKATLAIVQIGDNPARNSYIKGKLKDCQEIGYTGILYKINEPTTTEDILLLIEKLNYDKNTNGIIVQLPLPQYIDEKAIINSINPIKDVDGFLPNSIFTQCTPLGVISLFKEINYNLSGKFVVVLGRSENVGKPLANLLVNEDATVAICHSKTDMKTKYELLRMADVVVSAVGYAGLFSYKDVRPNALVIDIGINRVNGHLCGDFIPPNDDSKIMYTSVPGGIGLLTRATLMKNTKIAYEMQKNILD